MAQVEYVVDVEVPLLSRVRLHIASVLLWLAIWLVASVTVRVAGR